MKNWDMVLSGSLWPMKGPQSGTPKLRGGKLIVLFAREGEGILSGKYLKFDTAIQFTHLGIDCYYHILSTV